MATVKKTSTTGQVTKLVVVTEQVPGVQVELSMDEVQTLVLILGAVGGLSRRRREHSTPLYNSLYRILRDTDVEVLDHRTEKSSSYITLTDTK